jgi:hypothetical protein
VVPTKFRAHPGVFHRLAHQAGGVRWRRVPAAAIGAIAMAAAVAAVVAGFAMAPSTPHDASPILDATSISRDRVAADRCTDNPADLRCPPVGPADIKCTAAAWHETAFCAGGPFAPNIPPTPACSPLVMGCPGWMPPPPAPPSEPPSTSHEPPPPPTSPPPVTEQPTPAQPPPVVERPQPGTPATPVAPPPSVEAPPAPVAPAPVMAPPPADVPPAPVAPAPAPAPSQ